jgi:RNA polymerase sigma factor (TIGR02999 family)
VGTGENQPITALIHRWRAGDERAADALLTLVYGALHAIAKRQIDGQREISLVPGELVHEAFIKLNSGVPLAADRKHFYAIAARAMRQVLIDRELGRRAAKRSGERVTLTNLNVADPGKQLDLIALDQALTQLEAHDSRKARAIEMRTFAGLEFDDIAELLGISRATLARDYRAAQAWLRVALDLPVQL